MRWSKLKQTIEAGFAPSVGKRVGVAVTRYRRAHDAEGRWAITIDGREVGGLGCIVADGEQSKLVAEIREQEGLRPSQAQLLVDEVLCSRAHHTLPMFTAVLFEFTNMSIDAALESSDAVLRTMAILDRRLGKRRLQELAKEPASTDLERECLRLRLSAEGLELSGRLAD